MKNILVVLLIIISLPLASQERVDIGLVAGATYYMGDYNPGTQFYQPSPALGVMVRRNFNDFYSVRVSGLMGGLKGSHNPTKFFLPGDTPSFSTRIIEFEMVGEIGFMPFNTRAVNRKQFTPYAVMGIGGAYVNNSIILHIPMGIGLKYSTINRWSFGVEWRLHKTFSDRIDGYVNVSEKPRSFLHNNDWFGFGGIFVTYRIVNKGAICPVYE